MLQLRPESRPEPPPVPRVGWRAHLAYLDRVWQADGRSNPHVSILAPTRRGKTSLLVGLRDGTPGLLSLWDDPKPRDAYPWLLIDCKDYDETLEGWGHVVDQLHAERLRQVRHPRSRPWFRLRVPSLFRGETPATTPLILAQQQSRIFRALRQVWRERDFGVILDEVRPLLRLKLVDVLYEMWERGASQRVPLIAGTQAPRYMPGHFYDQPEHLYLGRVTDHRTRTRLREIGGNTAAIQGAVAGLDEHEFLYVGEGGNRLEIVQLGRG